MWRDKGSPRERAIAVAATFAATALAIYMIATEPSFSDGGVSLIAVFIPVVVNFACWIWLCRVFKTVRGLVVAVLVAGVMIAMFTWAINDHRRMIAQHRHRMARFYSDLEAESLKSANLQETRARNEQDPRLAGLARNFATSYRNDAVKYRRLGDAYADAENSPMKPVDTAPTNP